MSRNVTVCLQTNLGKSSVVLVKSGNTDAAIPSPGPVSTSVTLTSNVIRARGRATWDMGNIRRYHLRQLCIHRNPPVHDLFNIPESGYT